MEDSKVEHPKDYAGGLPAVTSSMKHVISRAGLARGTKALLEVNQIGGFDCPSCAWPDPDDERSVTEFCENGAKAVASEAMPATVDRAFFARHSIDDLRNQDDAWHDAQGRLAEPMVLRDGKRHYEPIGWDEAIQLIASELKLLDHPDEAIFYTSGRASNEAAFLYQMFARAFGTNNLPDCSNMCHESSGTALKEAIGIGKGTVTLDDLDSADVILCVGQNPGTNHPRMLATLERAVKNGAKVVAINPLKEAGLIGFAHPQKPSGMAGRATPLASSYLQIRVNGDMALFRGIAKCLQADDSFISEHTIGHREYQTVLDATSWDDIEKLSGITRAEIESLAALLAAGERKIITCWAMGITQHKNAVSTIREITNVHLLLGAIGRPAAGLCPVRGHSNVQGDRTVGIWEKAPEAFLASLDEVAGIQSPRKHGYDTVESILAMHRGAARVFFALGGNFAQASPDTGFTAEALARCTLTCHVATKLNRSHLIHGETALILPCLGRSEQDDAGFVSCENSMGVVQMSQGKLKPSSPDLLSETEIIARLGEATLGDTGNIRWRWLAEDYDRIRSMIESTIPGFEDYNARVRHGGGFYLPNAVKQRVWNTASGKAEFSATKIDAFEVKPGNFILQTVRSHDQYNTTVYGKNDRYRGISNLRRIVFLNPKDLESLGIRPMQPVDLTSHWHDGEREACNFLAIPYDMPRGTAAAYFPETNPLVPLRSTADGSNTPTSKSIEISIRKA